MNDLISRQAAIEEQESYMHDHLLDGYEDGRAMIAILKKLPSVEPERREGRWEIYVISMLDGEGCRCSECGFEGAPYWNYCPNCGADMRGEQND